MPLSQQQKYVLGQLGIPVWVKRQSKQHTNLISADQTGVLTIDPVDVDQLADVIIVSEKPVEDVMQKRLLAAILKSLSLSLEQVSQLELTQFDTLMQQQTSLAQRIFVFCDERMEEARFGQSVLWFPSLASILAKPAVKAQIWQQLKFQS